MIFGPPDRAASTSLLDDYLEPDEAATELGVTSRTLWNWHNRRIGPPRTLIGRKVVYRRAALREWLLSRETAEARAK